MNNYLPYIDQSDLQNKFGFRKSAFEVLENAGINTALFKIYTSTRISDSLLCETTENIVKINKYCADHNIKPIFAFIVDTPCYYSSKRLIIPKNRKALSDFLYMLQACKSKSFNLNNFNPILKKYRDEYFIGVNIDEYSLCPHKLRPFEFGGETFNKDEVIDNGMYAAEQFIQNYDFFYSLLYGKYSSVLNDFKFYQKASEQNIPFMLFPALLNLAFLDHTITIDAEKFLYAARQFGSEFYNYTVDTINYFTNIDYGDLKNLEWELRI